MVSFDLSIKPLNMQMGGTLIDDVIWRVPVKMGVV